MVKGLYKAVLIICFIILIVVLTNSKKNNEMTKLRIGMMPIADNLQLFVAKDKGFFKEEGIDIELIPMAGGNIIASAVESGDIDIGWSNIVSLIIAHDKGFDFQIISPGAFRDSSKGAFGNYLIVSNEIKKPKDLEGKVFAVNTLGNVNELIFRAWCDKMGVDFKKVNVVELPFPSMESALKNNQIAGAIVEEPFATLIISNNNGKIIDNKTYESISNRLLLASWFAKKSWIEKNQEKVLAFKRSIEKANNYILEHPQESRLILSNNTKLTEDISKKIILPLFDNEIKKSDIQMFIDSAKYYGLIEEKFDAEDIVWNHLNLRS